MWGGHDVYTRERRKESGVGGIMWRGQGAGRVEEGGVAH